MDDRLLQIRVLELILESLSKNVEPDDSDFGKLHSLNEKLAKSFGNGRLAKQLTSIGHGRAQTLMKSLENVRTYDAEI